MAGSLFPLITGLGVDEYQEALGHVDMTILGKMGVEESKRAEVVAGILSQAEEE